MGRHAKKKAKASAVHKVMPNKSSIQKKDTKGNPIFKNLKSHLSSNCSSTSAPEVQMLNGIKDNNLTKYSAQNTILVRNKRSKKTKTVVRHGMAVDYEKNKEIRKQDEVQQSDDYVDDSDEGYSLNTSNQKQLREDIISKGKSTKQGVSSRRKKVNKKLQDNNILRMVQEPLSESEKSALSEDEESDDHYYTGNSNLTEVRNISSCTESENEENEEPADASSFWKDNLEDDDSDANSEEPTLGFEIVQMEDRCMLKKKKFNEDSVRICISSKSAAAVLVVPHPFQLSFLGSALLSVIKGTVNILGCNVSSEHIPVPLYSCEKLFYLKIEGVDAEHKYGRQWMSVQKALKNYISDNEIDDIMRKCDDNSIIFVLAQNLFSPEVRFASTYINEVMPFVTSKGPKMSEMEKLQFNVSRVVATTISIHSSWEYSRDLIMTAFRFHSVDKVDTPRIMVTGNRGHGKSTFLRYVINKAFYSYENILYLDTDPGQCEFTPPGCMSLTEITGPLFGPPFTHLKKPLKCVFFGGLSLESSPSYCEDLDKIIEYYKQNFSGCPLLINTFGWTKDLGCQYLNHIRDAIKPTMEIELSQQYEQEEFDEATENVRQNARRYFRKGAPSIKLTIAGSGVGHQQNTAPLRRALSVFSYFGQSQNIYTSVTFLHELPSYRIPANHLAIHFTHCDVYPDHLLTAINATFVALCKVDQSQILQSEDESLPKRLIDNADQGDCLGFGLVRAVDFENNFLYIITPESRYVLREVNALVRGEVQMPEEAFLKQRLINVTLPYVRRVMAKKSPVSKKIKRRTYRERK